MKNCNRNSWNSRFHNKKVWHRGGKKYKVPSIWQTWQCNTPFVYC